MGVGEDTERSIYTMEPPEVPYIDLVDLNVVEDCSRVRPRSSVSNNPSPYNFSYPGPEHDGSDEPESKPKDETEQDDPPEVSVPTVELVRPSITYHGLIAMAILSSPSKKMTVEQICSYVSEKFPFYQKTEPTWWPFIKYTLALTSFFRRVKSGKGKDRYWAVRKNRLDLENELLNV